MRLFIRYLKQRLKVLIAFALFFIIFFVTFYMYHLPLEAVIYPALLCAALGILFLLADFAGLYKKHRMLCSVEKFTDGTITSFPEADSIEAQDYQRIILGLKEERAGFETDMNNRYTDMIEYYTVWAHQIKTPIASMKLTLQNEDTPLSRRLSADLFRIEQYVEMVLAFLRLGSDSTDYVIREYDLDEIIRQAVKKFAGEFIGRKLRLEYEPLNRTIITDEKWFSFCIEQVLSNALKYTREGGIKIYMEEPEILCIRDTGIGIAPEDLPRIFEKGYTGYNGRSDKKASGIGLYLCKNICGRLGYAITADSRPDYGTVIRINLEQHKSVRE